ncbi:hypothetical protein D3C81_2334190 [compost metagenome]
MATGIDHLEPLKMLDALACLGQGVVDRLFNGGRRGADEFDFLVGVVIRHGQSPF